MASVLPLVRLASFGTVIVFSIIVLGLCAHITNLTTTARFAFYFTFAAMGIATVIMTWGGLGTLLAVDRLRKGAIISSIVVELSVLGLLWIFWLTTAALVSQENALLFPSGCGGFRGTVCGEFAATVAFSWLSWLIIFGYAVFLLVLSIIAATRGNSVWFKSVSEADFDAPATEKSSPPVAFNPYSPQQTPQQQPVLQPQPSTMQPQYPPQSNGAIQPGFLPPSTPASPQV
ncbi:hypothetical protein ONZ45_g15953 [Pleurotus djamor]|nr:hypothetical protein ONZ45_g15953 [Pleurotus djamor]